jgi:hypothetical protein
VIALLTPPDVPPVLLLSLMAVVPILAAVQWDGQIWALATAKRRRVVARVLIALLCVGGTTTYAISYGFPNTCWDWVCVIFWACGC